MNVESVKLLKTLKAGEKTWIKGTVFPNKNCPQIPKEILGEVIRKCPTVKVLSENSDKIIVSKPVFLDSSDGETNTTMNAKVSLRNKELDNKPVIKKKQSEKIARSDPKKKKKSLVRRKK